MCSMSNPTTSVDDLLALLARLQRRLERYLALPALSAIQRHRLQRAEVAYEALLMRLALRGEVNRLEG